MKKIHYLSLIVVLFSCTKTMEVTKQPTPITGSGTVNLLSIKLISQDTISISKKYQPQVIAHYSNGFDTVVSLDSLVITSSDNTVFLNNKTYYGSKSGNAYFNITFKDFSIKDTTYVSEIENVDLSTLPFLTTPSNPNAKIIIPVVVVNYFPTLNGIDVDTRRAPGYGSLSPVTLETLKGKSLDYYSLMKYGLEEGTKFRGYNNPSQTSNVSFKVVKYVNIYEIKKGLKDRPGGVNYLPDYFDTFGKINLKELVEVSGVKEVWFMMRPLSDEYPVVKNENLNPENFMTQYETNMASPITGDISNSWRVPNDLPIYNKTYVVYGFSVETSAANMIHNRGHQIEAELSYLDSKFWGNYSNQTDGYADSTHLGCTHKPPNTTKDYDWNNKTYGLTDIEDWKPAGGVKKLINSDRWINLKYNIPSLISGYKYDEGDPQYKWLLYWMQSIPGYNNGITGVNDWWDIFYNWDNSIKNNSKLNN